MIGEHQVRAITQLITDLIPSCEVGCVTGEMDNSPNTKVAKSCTGDLVGMQICDSMMKLWLQINARRRYIFTITRDTGFTKAEKQIVCALLEVCRNLPIEDTNLVDFTQKSISSRFTIPYFLVAYFMRGANPSRLWSSVAGLVSLQQLSYKKYEGSTCTSGFLCLKSIGNTIPNRIVGIDGYTYEPFSEPIALTGDYFEKPLSYRYVDGKNSFYVVDNHGQIQGVIRNNMPKHFDIIDRCTYKHIEKLKSIPGFRWITHSGTHNDVIVHTKKRVVFQWDQNVWRNREISAITDLLISFGVDAKFAIELVGVLVTLSEMRMGALILITKEEKLPDTIGDIDTSELGLELKKAVKGSSFDYLRETNAILGLLASDGMTSFNTLGELINSGAIIDLTTAHSAVKISGGGRSQAACAASSYGMAIKVSEDGPITLYKKGKKLLEWR